MDAVSAWALAQLPQGSYDEVTAVRPTPIWQPWLRANWSSDNASMRWSWPRAAGVPGVMLEYQPKCRDFMESLGAQDAASAPTGSTPTTSMPHRTTGADTPAVVHERSPGCSDIDCCSTPKSTAWPPSSPGGSELKAIVAHAVLEEPTARAIGKRRRTARRAVPRPGLG